MVVCSDSESWRPRGKERARCAHPTRRFEFAAAARTNKRKETKNKRVSRVERPFTFGALPSSLSSSSLSFFLSFRLSHNPHYLRALASPPRGGGVCVRRPPYYACACRSCFSYKTPLSIHAGKGERGDRAVCSGFGSFGVLIPPLSLSPLSVFFLSVCLSHGQYKTCIPMTFPSNLPFQWACAKSFLVGKSRRTTTGQPGTPTPQAQDGKHNDDKPPIQAKR